MADRQKRKARRRAASDRPAPTDAGPAPRRPAGDGDPNAGMRRGYARAEAKNAAARAALVPLRAGDPKPLALRLSIGICAAIALANTVLALVGFLGDVEIAGQTPGPTSLLGALVFSTIIGAAAWGMWTTRYWAILGFQALLAITVIALFLFIVVAPSLLVVLIPLTVISAGGWLFWKNINVMARIQKAERMDRGLEL